MVYFDIAKGFDEISHKIIIEKHQKIDLPHNLIALLQNF